MTTVNNRLYWLALTHLPNMGGVSFRTLLKQFGSIEAIFCAPPTALPPTWATLIQTISLSDLISELAELNSRGISLITWDDETYPAELHALRSTPPVLFQQGVCLPTTNTKTIAIVGSRQISPAEVTHTHQLAEQLTQHGYMVVSGLARGVDTAAHQGALTVSHGQTMAVLGSGLLNIYPPENRPLANQIKQRGALLSEQRPLTSAEPVNLMIRNRLIAGLSTAVVVTAASANSGAIETARQAKRLNRPIFACPGSPGCDRLIHQGAIPLVGSVVAQVTMIEQYQQTAPPTEWVQETLW